MTFLEISEEYPKRGTREIVTIDNMSWWLLDVYNARLLDNADLRSVVLRTTEELLNYRYCAVCGRRYQRIQITHYLHDLLLTNDDCCFGCPLQAPSEEQLPTLMRHLVDACGFIPESGAYFEQSSFLSRLDERTFLPTAAAYTELGGVFYWAEIYGSWMKAVLLSGVLGGNARVTKRGVICIADDGDLCLSLGELAIDNWLSARGIEHEREPKYPVHPEMNPRGNLRADWKVGDIYIEYFGLAGEEAYDRKRHRKRELAREMGIQLISLLPADMRDLETALGALLGTSRNNGAEKHQGAKERVRNQEETFNP